MTGTFGSLNIARSGLQYQQLAIDIADTNISNVNTPGYTRKRAEAMQIGGTTNPTMWSTYTGHGDGVVAASVKRLSDVLLDTRARRENANLSYLTVQQSSLTRMETLINEPSKAGVNQAISDFKAALQDLANNPQLPAAREATLAKAQSLAAALNNQSRNLDAEVGDLAVNAAHDVAAVNDDAEQIANLNHQIFLNAQSGTDVSDLEDKRDQLALDIANKAGGVVTVQADGRYTVTIGGATLVDGSPAGDGHAGSLSLSGDAATGTLAFSLTQPDGTSIPDPSDPAAASLVPSGELGGIQVLTNTTIPTYRSGLNAVAATLADQVNAAQEAGYDLAGNSAAGAPIFAYTPGNPAGTLTVVMTDPTRLAAAAGAGQVYDGTNADALTTAADVSDAYQRLVSQLGATAAGINAKTSNQQALTSQIGNEQQQLAGVSIDEETINLMQAQRAYEASARVLTVLDSMLNTLINHTGLTG